MSHTDLTPMTHDDRDGRHEPWPSVVRGRVIGAPATDTDSVTVQATAFGSAQGFVLPPSNWMPRITATGELLPIVGQSCVLLFDDAGDVWMGCWG